MSNSTRHTIDERLYLHQPDECNIRDIPKTLSAEPIWAHRSTTIQAMTLEETIIQETRLAPSQFGFVAICYETRGLITFYVQLNATRAAWQRIAWEPNYADRWNAREVQNAVDRFLLVAEQKNAAETA